MTNFSEPIKNRNHDERFEAALAGMQQAHRRAKSEKLHGRVILELSYNGGQLEHWIEDYKRVNR